MPNWGVFVMRPKTETDRENFEEAGEKMLQTHPILCDSLQTRREVAWIRVDG